MSNSRAPQKLLTRNVAMSRSRSLRRSLRWLEVPSMTSGSWGIPDEKRMGGFAALSRGVR